MQISKYYELHEKDGIDWNLWGEEPLNKAKSSGKLLFISIGYSTCHWCHVFQEETLRNEEVKKILNDHYIPIIVDREHRPDVDSLYMRLAQIMNGSGGWPLNVVAIPTGEPIFISSYLPPYNRDEMPGMINVLSYLHDLWQKDKSSVIESALKGISYLNIQPKGSPSETIHSDTMELLLNIYDREFGGFGQEPKFPSFTLLSFIITYSQLFENYLFMAEKTMRSIRYGGIYDHIGNGIFRYTVDRKWLIPHFEKMLYDQLMLKFISEKLYKIKKDNFYSNIMREIDLFLSSTLKDPDNGFYYSALDADWNGQEGGYYLWKEEQLGVALENFYPKLAKYYSKVELEDGYLLVPPLGADLNSEEFKEINARLLEFRKNNKNIERDDKLLTGLNALAISFDISKNLGDSSNRIKKFLDTFHEGNGRLYRYYRKNKGYGSGVLEDYAYTINMLINYYFNTLDNSYFPMILKISRYLNDNFYDYENGGYFTSEKGEKTLPSRIIEENDSTYYSGNSIMFWNLLRMHSLMEIDEYQMMARGVQDKFRKYIETDPLSHIGMIEFQLISDRIVTVKGNPSTLKSLMMRLDYPINLIPITQEIEHIEVCLPGKCEIIRELNQINNYSKYWIY